ncbi:Stress-induced-phosphoprotein 1 [Smittium culicis]|uniref:Stress-induced-phosphoprotein 1 n=1 Tax=Smittium culicis TaxID=133412 RepID=A0A1R1XXQ9_9FUNG|nr:Stress-induced-phosphoprotein 1 [Smittium culicis]
MFADAENEKNKGNAFFKANQYPQAVTHYSNAIRIDPHNPAYLANRAIALIKLSKLKYILYLPLNPPPLHFPNTNPTPAIPFTIIFRFEEAVSDCSASLKLEPDNVAISNQKQSKAESSQNLIDIQPKIVSSRSDLPKDTLDILNTIERNKKFPPKAEYTIVTFLFTPLPLPLLKPLTLHL